MLILKDIQTLRYRQSECIPIESEAEKLRVHPVSLTICWEAQQTN